jgi:hypothetical protein
MDIQKEFNNLELKFSKINAKIILKTPLIHNLYENDVRQIHDLFDGDITNQSSGNILNEHREKLLDQLNYTIENAIMEINDLADYSYTSLNNARGDSLTKFIMKAKSLNSLVQLKYKQAKENFLHLSQTFPIASDLNRYKYKLTKPFDLMQINKYKHLLKNDKTYQLNVPSSVMEHDKFSAFELISSNRVLYTTKNNENFLLMYIINKEGQISHSSQVKLYEFGEYKVLASLNRIVLVYERPENHGSQRANIYDLNLNLVKSLELGHSYYPHFLINQNNEIAIKSSDFDKITIFNLISLKSNEIKFQCEHPNEKFYISDEMGDYLFHFDERNIFFRREDGLIYLTDRITGSRVYEIKLNSIYTEQFFMFNKVNFDQDLKYDIVEQVHKIDNEEINFYDINDDTKNSKIIFFSNHDSIIYYFEMRQKQLKLNEY